MHQENQVKTEALRAGAAGFLSKDCSMQEVVTAVRQVVSPDGALSAELASAMLAEMEPASEHVESPLTGRETEILQLIADGRSTTETAGELFISAKTVKNHLAAIYAKLEARDRTQAVLTGVRIGIIQLN
jgi:DNA-binding NarL/FixJ family response regulator